jgi:hypothetical protein
MSRATMDTGASAGLKLLIRACPVRCGLIGWSCRLPLCHVRDLIRADKILGSDKIGADMRGPYLAYGPERGQLVSGCLA